MKKLIKQNKELASLVKDAKSFYPTVNVKHSVLRSVFRHIKANPLPEKLDGANLLGTSMLSPYRYLVKQAFRMRAERKRHFAETGEEVLFRKSVFYLRLIRIIPVIILAMLLLAGGTAMAANAALPGDFLYPYKTGVNERIGSLAAFTPEARAMVHAKYASRRLAEARALSFRGEIPPNAQAVLNTNFKFHAAKALALTEVLRQKGKEKEAEIVEKEFEAEMLTHKSIVGFDDDEGDDSLTDPSSNNSAPANNSAPGNSSTPGNSGKGKSDDGGQNKSKPDAPGSDNTRPATPPSTAPALEAANSVPTKIIPNKKDLAEINALVNSILKRERLNID
ncbi:MAG TPA: DUF5667 domain-containing protein [Candidatus Paceibacterota bacterium]|nr:DUF5667 domain-containing protein [Candidatus Paceibacterota bacterium]